MKKIKFTSMEFHKKYIQKAASLQPQAQALGARNPVGVAGLSGLSLHLHNQQRRPGKPQDSGSQTYHKALDHRRNSNNERRGQEGHDAHSRPAPSWCLLKTAQAAARAQR